VVLSDSRAKVICGSIRTSDQSGSEATIKTMGLLGDKFVDLVPPERRTDRPEGGMPDAAGKPAFLQPEETIQATISPSDVDKLINQLSGIAGDIKEVTGSLRQVLGTEAGARSMEDILHDLRDTMANIKEFSITLQGDGSEPLVMRLNELAGSLNAVVGENRTT
jgi:ABC-type transporter Mla subunit MlaD